MIDLNNEFPTITIKSATDCFRMGTTINQLRRLCVPSTQSLSSIEHSEPTYSSIKSLNNNSDDEALNEIHDVDDKINDDDKDNLICEKNLMSTTIGCVQPRQRTTLYGAELMLLCLGRRSRLRRPALITKLDDVAEKVNLDVSTILAEQFKDPVLGSVRSWLRKGISIEAKLPKIRHSHGLNRYCHEFDRLLIEEEGQLLCYNESSDKLKTINY